MLRAVRQQRLEREFAMLEKQVRMLVELEERSPVVQGKLTNEIVEALEPGTEYVILERQQLNVLLEGADVQIVLLKDLTEKLYEQGEFRPKEPFGS